MVLWRGENLRNYLTKGKQLYVEGRMQTRSYEDKDGKKVYATEVVADEVILLGGQGGGGGRSGGGDEYSQQPVSMPRSAQRSAPPSLPRRRTIIRRELRTTTFRFRIWPVPQLR